MSLSQEQEESKTQIAKQTYSEEQKASRPNTIAVKPDTNTSPDTYALEDKFVTIFVLFFFVYIIATIISFGFILANDDDTDDHVEKRYYGNFVYYAGLIVYQIAVIIVSYWSYINLSSLPANPKAHRTWYELVFYIKFSLCSLFNLFTGILLGLGLICDRKDGAKHEQKMSIWILMMMSYFINIVSIPLPGIVFFKYLKAKKSFVQSCPTSRTASKSTIPPITTPLLSSNKELDLSNTSLSLKCLYDANIGIEELETKTEPSPLSAELDVRKNVFNDKSMLTGICGAYFIHFLAYILFPSVTPDEFNKLLQLVYIKDNKVYDAFYIINHIVLRSFKGMSLYGLYFVFFANIVGNDQERYPKVDKSDWQSVKLLLRNNYKFWIIVILLVAALSIVDLYHYFITDNSNIYVNVFWIFINVIGIIISSFYLYYFKGAYKKYTKSYNNRFRGGKTVDNISYGLKAMLLFVLFIVQLICLLDASDDNESDWFRMLSVLGFTALQFITLILLRAIQSNNEYIRWCKKHGRQFYVKWIYFRFLIFLNIADLSFVYMYPQKYYTIDKLNDAQKRTSYAMSFASPAIVTISLAQLVISYAKFEYQLCYPSQVEMSESSQQPISNNNKTKSAHV